jgi:hypothetical protein
LPLIFRRVADRRVGGASILSSHRQEKEAMSANHFPKASRALVVGLWGAAIVFSSTPGNGQSPRQSAVRRSCASSYERGQELRQGSKLRRAREVLLGCSRAACGDFVQRECSKWITQIDAETPSMVLLAKDEAGVAVLDVEVTMDGELLTSRLDGRAVSVDPGMHDFTFKTATGILIQRRVAISLGERNRVVSVDLPAAAARASAPAPAAVAKTEAKEAKAAPPSPRAEPAAAASHLQLKTMPSDDPPPSPSPSTSGGGSIVPYVVGGVGALGIGGYALLYSMAKSENNALIDQCWPTCSEERLNRVRNLYLGADISLGVGVAALGTATYLFFQSSSGREKPAGQAASYVVDVAPSRAGVYASVSGAF